MLTTNEAAKLLETSAPNLRKMCAAGMIRYYQISKFMKFEEEDILEFKKSCYKKGVVRTPYTKLK